MEIVKRNKKIVYVNFCGIISNNAFHSQVKNMIAYLVSTGRTIDYLGCEKFFIILHKRKLYMQAIKRLEKLISRKGVVMSFPTASGLLFPLHFVYLLIYCVLNGINKYNFVFHCRTELTTVKIYVMS